MNEDQSWPNELQKQVDDAHHTTNRADTPPPGLWSSIRAQAQPREEPKERQPMINTATMPQTLSSPVRSRPVSQEGGFRHYANLVATVALVLAVAVGGWLAMSQLPSGESDPRFAVLGTPEVADATCDVEPMTVDEVMEIVENPYKYAEPSAYGPPNSSPAPWYDDFAEVQPMVSESVSAVLGQEPTETAMQEALAILDQYQACMETGTMAQVLRFVDPFSIHGRVTQQFPFYRDEEQVREFVTNWIEETPAPLEWKNDETGVVLTFSPNRNTEEAKTQFLWLGLGFNQLLFIGSNVLDEQGNFLARHDATFEVVEGEQQERFTRYTLVYSMYTEKWYVVPGDWPMAPRI